MIAIGEFCDVEYVVDQAGVVNALGLQCGILVNTEERQTILIQDIPKRGVKPAYPNEWDRDVPGLLRYCGTNKGLTAISNEQNLNSKLNKHLNEGIYPIHVFVRYPDKKYRYVGEFDRAKEYDERLVLKGKKGYRFGLVAHDSRSLPVIAEIKMIVL